MKTSRFSEPQILAILRQAEGGVPVSELCREHGMSTASFYKWRAKYGGMDASMISQMIIESIEEAQEFATQWLWTYNNERPNMGIGGITPAQKLKMAA